VLAQARYDPESVRTLFDDMASTYGHVNLVSSFGFTARWRRQAVAGLPLAAADRVVDLMSGMGELWRSLAMALPAPARVVGVDISPEMARRTRREWHFTVEVCVTDVLAWEPQSASADIVVSSFGLKTFDREQQRRLAHTVAQLLKPWGSLFIRRDLSSSFSSASCRLYVLPEAADSARRTRAAGQSGQLSNVGGVHPGF
jgi:ubiquinone/menaquinone biosynthesis C-methylase UbiE